MACGGPYTFYVYRKLPTEVYQQLNAISCPNSVIQQELQERDEEIAKLVGNGNLLQRRINALNLQSKQKDEEINRLNMNCNQLLTSYSALQQQLKEKDEEITKLVRNGNLLQTRNGAPQKLLNEKDEEIAKLKEDCNQQRTRLSELAAMQLTARNPNITDLSDPNRPEILAEQFSELYDNAWTDCFQTLTDSRNKTEEQAVQILLTIVKTTYDITLERNQNIIKVAKDALETLVGKSDEEPEMTRDTLIQEVLHKLQSYRTKNFRGAPKDIAMAVEERLSGTIDQQAITTCSSYIEECVRICWLMCIKDPPMYIYCEREDIFDKSRFVEYTEKGSCVSYVVWPVLYLHRNGPIMRKGWAQGKENEPSKRC